ncbi:MAG: hypothetical protein OEV68_10610, partial [candidate division Zixibacteria bacterium]|nr:hypothetical protein [candidate division Zixibacteria bacterium]
KKPTSKPEPAQVVQQVAQEESEKPKTETKQAAPQAAPQNDKSEPDQASHKTEKDENDLGLREDVLTFYGQLYEDLPKDLTSQERKVALYEISIKTAAEYSITMPQLKAICEDYYLSY